MKRFSIIALTLLTLGLFAQPASAKRICKQLVLAPVFMQGRLIKQSSYKAHTVVGGLFRRARHQCKQAAFKAPWTYRRQIAKYIGKRNDFCRYHAPIKWKTQAWLSKGKGRRVKWISLGTIPAPATSYHSLYKCEIRYYCTSQKKCKLGKQWVKRAGRHDQYTIRNCNCKNSGKRYVVGVNSGMK